MQRKTITLTEQQDEWVKSQIQGGRFGNDSEYIRDLIRRDQQTQQRIEMLRRALVAGEKSGPTRPLDIDAVKQSARSRAQAR